MKYFVKGICLGLSLFLANKICCNSFAEVNLTQIQWFSAVIFFLITTAFLVSKKIQHLLLCGFSGLFVMFFTEIISFSYLNISPAWLISYIGGFYGSMIALGVSIIMTQCQIKLFKEDKTMKDNFSTDLKIKLLIYAVISAIGFSYLIMPENSSISVPVFAVIQFVYLWFTVPDRKRLVLLIPVFIMAANCFWSANHIWRLSNLIISIVLYACMFMDFKFKSTGPEYLTDAAKHIIAPFTCFRLPFKWAFEFNSEKAPVIKRIALGLAVTIPCAALLVIILSNADMVFYIKTNSLLASIFRHINFHTVYIGIAGIFAGLYLFGTACCANAKNDKPEKTGEIQLKGDLIIINILLFVTLFIYTLFVIIQFKYLFAGSALPQGLTYTEYARKGFFELLALTGVNIAAILAVTAFTRIHEGKWATFSKTMCHYLCGVTIVLLASSFYRMLLYTYDDGLTRLRFFVMGFLIFEAIGLLITFVYIAKPRFNITLVYITLALIYYSVLNIIPADNIIAKNQINKFLNNERSGLEYVFTLSADAAPAMEYLYKSTNDTEIKESVKTFLENKTQSEIPSRWQRYNLSTERAKDILTKLK